MRHEYLQVPVSTSSTYLYLATSSSDDCNDDANAVLGQCKLTMQANDVCCTTTHSLMIEVMINKVP
jgi:hypothetical protein